MWRHSQGVWMYTFIERHGTNHWQGNQTSLERTAVDWDSMISTLTNLECACPSIVGMTYIECTFVLPSYHLRGFETCTAPYSVAQHSRTTTPDGQSVWSGYWLHTWIIFRGKNGGMKSLNWNIRRKRCLIFGDRTVFWLRHQLNDNWTIVAEFLSFLTTAD